MELYKDIEEELNNLRWIKTSKRTNVSDEKYISSMVIGQYRDAFSRKMKDAKLNENADLLDKLDKLIKFIDKDFQYTTITLNKNLKCKPHIDKNNKNLSIIVGLGNYTGGELIVEDKEYDIKYNPLLFDGKKVHSTKDFDGTRYTLVYYNQ